MDVFINYLNDFFRLLVHKSKQTNGSISHLMQKSVCGHIYLVVLDTLLSKQKTPFFQNKKEVNVLIFMLKRTNNTDCLLHYRPSPISLPSLTSQTWLYLVSLQASHTRWVFECSLSLSLLTVNFYHRTFFLSLAQNACYNATPPSCISS